MKNQTVKTYTNGTRQVMLTPQQIAYMTKGDDGKLDGQWSEVVNEAPKQVFKQMERLKNAGTGKAAEKAVKKAAGKAANKTQPKKDKAVENAKQKVEDVAAEGKDK